MFQQIPLKRKLYFWTGLLIFGLLSSVLYLRNGAEAKEQYRKIKNATDDIRNAPNIFNQQKRELQELDQQIVALNPNKIHIHNHNHFIQYTEELCKKYEVRLVSLPAEDIRKVGEYELAEITLSLEGPYTRILELLFEMEHKDRIVTVSKLNMQIESVRREQGKDRYLVASIILNRLLNQKS